MIWKQHPLDRPAPEQAGQSVSPYISEEGKLHAPSVKFSRRRGSSQGSPAARGRQRQKTLDASFRALLRFRHWSRGARIRAEREAGAIPARSRHCDQRVRRRSRPLLLQAMGRQPVGRPSCQSGDLPRDWRGTLRTRAAGSNMHTGLPYRPSWYFSTVRISIAALPSDEDPRSGSGFSGQ